jgi:death on curing protein
LLAAQVFLNLNNYDLNETITNETLIDFIIKIASGQSSLEECQAWFLANTIPI